MSKKKRFPPKPTLFDDIAAGPRWVRWLVLAGGVCVAHAAAAFFMGLEADSSTEMLLMAMISALVIGLFMYGSGYDALTTTVAAGGPPAIWAKWHWYWKVDMHSPAGAAQALVEWLFAWSPPPPAYCALGGVLGAIGLSAWSFGWFNYYWERKTGSKFLELEE